MGFQLRAAGAPPPALQRGTLCLLPTDSGPQGGRGCRPRAPTLGSLRSGGLAPHPHIHSEAPGRRQSSQSSNMNLRPCLREARPSLAGLTPAAGAGGSLWTTLLGRVLAWLQRLPFSGLVPQSARTILGRGSATKRLSWELGPSGSFSRGPASSWPGI